MAGINLLTTDLAPKASVVKASGAIKKLTTLGIIALVVSLCVSIGLFLTFNNQLRTSSARTSQLGESIRALEQTEQRLVLIKDRLSLAKEAQLRGGSVQELLAIQKVVDSFPEGIRVQKFKIEKDIISASITAQNSTALTQMLAILVSTEGYTNVELSALTFVPSTGFSTNFILIAQ
jgi:Tfp pilus assembly protein PilN